MKTMLWHYEYVWFLDKLNWNVITFQSSHWVNMIFNTLSLQIIYHSQYCQIIESKSDFIKFHDVFALMKTHHFNIIRLMLLLYLLTDLVFHIFYKDVFIALIDDKIKQSLNFKQIMITQKRNISLTETEVFWVFLHLDFSDDLQFLTQTHQRVISIEILFTWLWNWNENDSDNDWSHMHWKSKLYCVLFCQMFDVIVQTYELQQTHKWWAHMRHTFIHSH